MNTKLTIGIILILMCFAVPTAGQLRSRTSDKNAAPRAASEIRASAAFAEVLLRRTELESNLEELLVSYKEDFPRVKAARYELALLESEMTRFAKMKSGDASKLTIAVGKLIVRRAELATDYWSLANRYEEAHPDVRKARRKVEIYDAAIEEIM